MTNKQKTLLGIGIGVVAYAIWDTFLASNERKGDTISEVTLAESRKLPVIPFAVGIVAGHLFWPQEVQASVCHNSKGYQAEVLRGSQTRVDSR
jgi:hypothetical protein